MSSLTNAAFARLASLQLSSHQLCCPQQQPHLSVSFPRCLSACVPSVSDVQLETRTDSRSTLSVDSSVGSGGPSGGHGGHRTYTWTPPLSVEGSTPTWTEGTPSFTESSSSGDLGCPSTPVRSLNTTTDSTHHETEMKRIKCSSTAQQHLLRLSHSNVSKTGPLVIKQRHSPLPPSSAVQLDVGGRVGTAELRASPSPSTAVVNGSTCSVEVAGEGVTTTSTASKYTVTLQVYNDNNNSHEQEAENITTRTADAAATE